MKLTLWNLPENISDSEIRALISPHVPEFSICSVHIVPDEDPKHAMAIVDLELDAFAAGGLALELDGKWHAGAFLRAHVLNHP
jgi:hypothetical protein